MRAIIPSAGKGTRLNPSPDAPPKALFPLCGRPLIDHVLEQTNFIAPSDTYIIIGYKGDEIVNHCGDKYRYVWQHEQLGTGHAVMQCAQEFADYDGTVLVTFGDMPLFRRDCMRSICALHESRRAACTLLTAVNPELTMWARILRDANGRFRSIVEGKDCTPDQAKITELFAGVLVFDSRRLFEYLPRLHTANVQHELYLTEVPEMMASDGLTVETFPTDDPDDLRGINTPSDIPLCESILKRRLLPN